MSMSRDDLHETIARSRTQTVADNPTAARRRREQLVADMAAYLARGGQITPAPITQLRAGVSQSARPGSAARVWVETADGNPPRRRRVVDALFAGDRARRGG